MKIVTTAAAQRDLRAYVEYLREHNPDASDRFLDEYDALILSLARREFDGPEASLRGRRLRTWPLPPRRVYYVRLRDALEIVRVYHQSRRPIAK